LGKTPFVEIAWHGPETVEQRPCAMREIETWLSDIRVGDNRVVDHRS